MCAGITGAEVGCGSAIPRKAGKCRPPSAVRAHHARCVGKCPQDSATVVRVSQPHYSMVAPQTLSSAPFSIYHSKGQPLLNGACICVRPTYIALSHSLRAQADRLVMRRRCLSPTLDSARSSPPACRCVPACHPVRSPRASICSSAAVCAAAADQPAAPHVPLMPCLRW